MTQRTLHRIAMPMRPMPPAWRDTFGVSLGGSLLRVPQGSAGDSAAVERWPRQGSLPDCQTDLYRCLAVFSTPVSGPSMSLSDLSCGTAMGRIWRSGTCLTLGAQVRRLHAPALSGPCLSGAFRASVFWVTYAACTIMSSTGH